MAGLSLAPFGKDVELNFQSKAENKDISKTFELNYDEDYSPKYDYNIGVYLEGLNKKIVEVEDINIVIEETEALTVIDVNSKKRQENSLKASYFNPFISRLLSNSCKVGFQRSN